MRPLGCPLLVVTLILITAVACSTTESRPATATPSPPTQSLPTLPTEVVLPITSASEFFTEEFDSEGVLTNWENFSMGSGEETNLVIKQQDDHLLFDLGSEDLYVYYVYKPFEYEDVSIKLSAENLGQNNNNISLVCRMNPERSRWYEFSVENGGLWYLYAVDGQYNILSNGGARALKRGQEVNEYAMTCNGDEISLYVNGQKLKTVTDSTYGFPRGKVGFNISSLNVLPITVAVDWFEISRP